MGIKEINERDKWLSELKTGDIAILTTYGIPRYRLKVKNITKTRKDIVFTDGSIFQSNGLSRSTWSSARIVPPTEELEKEIDRKAMIVAINKTDVDNFTYEEALEVYNLIKAFMNK